MAYEDPPYELFSDGTLGGALAKLWGGASVKTMGLAGLQGVTTAAGLMAQMGATRRAGENAKRSAFLSAQDSLLNASQAYVDAQGDVTGLRRKLADQISSRVALAGASGVAGGQGLVQEQASELSRRSVAAEGVARTNAEIRAARHRIDALTTLMKGQQADEEARRTARAQLGSGILSGLLGIGRLFQ